MGNRKPAIKSGPKSNLLAGQAAELPLPDDGYIVFSFRHLDLSQGQTFIEWQKAELLSDAMDKFKHYSTQKMVSAFCDKFKCYGAMPDHCEFKHPKHVPQDAKWTSMHIKGKECVIGH